MTVAELSIAIAALLITPGPTNTLLAIAGAERGALRAFRLIPAELGGYLTTVIPLSLVGANLLESFPGIRPFITLAAAAWVMSLAVSMWQLPQVMAGGAPVATARRIFVTTLLNPKALIFGLVLLPTDTGVWMNIGNFTAQVVLVAMMWATLGSFLSRAATGEPTGLPHWLRRVAAVWLAIVSVGLVVRVLSA
jgi:threonine/homoserine/homoserine lactone efflux protein